MHLPSGQSPCSYTGNSVGAAFAAARSATRCFQHRTFPAGAKMLDHCNAYDTSFYVNLKSSLKKKTAAAQTTTAAG